MTREWFTEISMGYAPVPYNYLPRKANLVYKSNILIDNSGHACIAGFNLLTIIPDELSITSSNPPKGTTQWVGSMRWSAPEVLRGGVPTEKTDVYSFAMIMIEVRHGYLRCVNFGLSPFLVNAALHRYGSVQ